MKNVKRINESQLRAIVTESVKRVLNEDYSDINGDPNEVLMFRRFWNNYDDKVKNLMAAYAYQLKQQGYSNGQAMGTVAFTMNHDTVGVTGYFGNIVDKQH